MLSLSTERSSPNVLISNPLPEMTTLSSMAPSEFGDLCLWPKQLPDSSFNPASQTQLMDKPLHYIARDSPCRGEADFRSALRSSETTAFAMRSSTYPHFTSPPPFPPNSIPPNRDRTFYVSQAFPGLAVLAALYLVRRCLHPKFSAQGSLFSASRPPCTRGAVRNGRREAQTV